ncbi:MAG: prepilin-type N-terminal cleavage/methylation domain-containing protein [Ruminococcus albus]|nr:prepilin-type N-terminal cleavage/methylation domain-containing protein [Ruminococcus albus]
MKTNKKGFTLIELIIVSTIMVMIMGAILNFIQPMNNFYQRTLYNSDANDVGNILQDTFESQIRYATNICVLEGYEGVPAVVDGYLRDSTGGKAINAKYTDVIVIDNDSLRGSVMAGYDENGNVAHRKRARGQLLYAPLNKDGIDMDKLEIVGGEPLYSDMKCEFEGYINVDDSKNNCLTLSSKLYKPEGNGTSYDFKKLIFNQKRDFELVNINLRSDVITKYSKYSAEYYTTRVDTNDPTKYLAQTLDYAKFARESTSTSSNPNVSYLYNGNDENGNAISFTYIFYTKSVPDNEKVTITVKHEDGATIAEKTDFSSGSIVTDAMLTEWKTLANSPAYVGLHQIGSDWYRITFKYFDANGADFETIKDAAITNDLELIARYDKQIVPSPSFWVKFYDRFDDSNVWIDDANGKYNSNPYWSVPIYTPVCSEGDDVLDSIEVKYPGGDGVHEFDHWEDGSGNVLALNELGTTSHGNNLYYRTIYGDEEYFAVYKDPAVLTFVDETDAELNPSGDSDVVTIRHSATGNEVTLSSEFTTSPEIQAFINAKTAAKKTITWKVYDSSNNYVADLETMSSFPDTENNFWVKPELGDMPAATLPSSVIETEKNVSNLAYYAGTEKVGNDYKNFHYPTVNLKFSYRNNSDTDIDNVTITVEVEFNVDIESLGVVISDENGSVSLSGNKLYITKTGNLPKYQSGDISLGCKVQYIEKIYDEQAAKDMLKVLNVKHY